MRPLVLLCVFASCAAAQGEAEKELAVGRQMFSDISSREKIITDPVVTGFADGILKRLSSGDSVPIRVQIGIVDRAELVASALPGGHLLISSGAILGAQTEAEFAALLAHALGHIQDPRPIQPVRVDGRLPMVFIGGPWGSCWRSANASLHLLMPASFALDPTAVESRADLAGLAFLARAGYDAAALISVFETWGTTSRPDDAARAIALQLSGAKPEAVINSSGFDDIRARLRPVVSPSRPPTLYRSN